MASILDELVASVRGLGTRVRTYAQTAPVNLTAESAKVGGETESTVRGKMQSSHVGLGTLVNAAPAMPVQVVARAPQVYATRKDAGAIWTEETAHMRGQPGDNFFVGEDKVITGLLPGASMEYLNVVTNDAELDTAKKATESMETVFKTWNRISRGKWNAPAAEQAALGYSDNAIPSELEAFTYDPATGKIKNSADTFSLVGFLSPRPYADYVLDVTLRSDSIWQNDPLGLILGHVRDTQGNTHTLTVMCNPWGNCYGGKDETRYPVMVVVDYNVPGSVAITGTGKGLKWVNGADGEQPMPAIEHPYSVKPWVLAVNGWRLRVTRAGNTFTVETSGYDVPTLTPAATFSFTLDDHPALARFKGAQVYGYAGISQDMAVWDVAQRPGAKQSILDTRSGTLWEWNGSAWVVNPAGSNAVIKPNRFYFNQLSRKLFYAETKDLLLNIL